MLVACGAKLWEKVKDSFPDPLTEVPLSATLPSGHLLTGHKDILSISGNRARAADWKTGRKDTDYSHQMRAYGTLILLENPELVEVTVTLLWVRDQEIENYTMTRAQAADWLKRLRERVIDWDGTFSPGSHCQYCKRSHECHAATAMIRRDVAAFSIDVDPGESGSLATMTPAEIVDVYRKAKLVKNYADRVLSAIKSHAEDGDICADGTRLTISESETSEVIPLEAWPILEAAGFTDEDLASCVKIGLTKMKKAAAQRAGRGNGAAAVRDLMAKLNAAGAVRYGTRITLQEKRDV
jgi:hypothetical protein